MLRGLFYAQTEFILCLLISGGL